MDEGLFTKHLRVIKAKQVGKQEVLQIILQATGISLTEDEISLSKKKVKITTSSVVKAMLAKKKVNEHLISAGYVVSL